MDDALKQAFYSRMQEEPFARKFGLKLCDIGAGYSKVEMTFTPDMENMWGCAHGGALFALIDQSFEVAANSHGTLAVALNMSVTFVAPPRPGSVLSSEAKETYQTRKTASYDIKVRDGSGALIASCQALVYRKGTPLPFLKNNPEEPRR
ncbi:MAG: PaaI family thioesterase [Desulfobacteraceae bacterium]|nr:PaaI family thioesterase [Desulfobacteraceae bacterium]